MIVQRGFRRPPSFHEPRLRQAPLGHFYDVISHGLGAMRSIELVRSAEIHEPADEETKQVVKYCYEHGLITISAGTYSNVIRLLMPLVITDEQFAEALGVLESALGSVSAAPASSAKKAVHA